MTNFYAIDVETTGFMHNEPIQIAAVRFKNGEPADFFNTYFTPYHDIEDAATKVHQLTVKKLQQLDAVKWTFWRSKLLSDFLHESPDLPIVGHSVTYDKDQVLRPAFDRVKNAKGFPREERWRCTYQLSHNIPYLRTRDLDSVIWVLGMEPRAPNAAHDALKDAILSGNVFMELMK